ncbi:hypothetical protein BGZ61DRAFT_72297 [Ilyonectria robusta]|uniref:uncharacterized protein n=1 Tax=Ilyonectria robusta TaxID=1079257 RepID=UPI001E8EC16B|nr:uncharacterized protein BGZ61DRAFT_72297 [Ilyonectria robusta]KAH8676969.1 hypothetical protein BGZ61DRAFT_72297 [Ilyonectria robusta]
MYEGDLLDGSIGHVAYPPLHGTSSRCDIVLHKAAAAQQIYGALPRSKIEVSLVFCFFRRRQATYAGKELTRIDPGQTASSATVTHNPACLRAVFHHNWADGAAERSNIKPKVHCTSDIPCLRFTLPSRHPFTASSILHRRVRWRDILRTGKGGTNRDRGKRAAAPG